MLGGLYDPTLQTDYGSHIFSHDKARLKAHPFYNKYNRLLNPWNLPVSLRAGTLIVFETTFHCYKYGKQKVYCSQSENARLTKYRSSNSTSSRLRYWRNHPWLLRPFPSLLFQICEMKTMKVLPQAPEDLAFSNLESRELKHRPPVC